MRISSLRLGSHWLSGRTFRAAALIGLVAGGGAGKAGAYTWPLGTGQPPYAAPDVMNTSFGPRVNNDKWDFHDGIDLPAYCGRPVHAVAGGTVILAGRDNFLSSQHVVIKVNDLNNVYVIYLHLRSVTVALNAQVSEKDIIGEVGDDGALYCHLHLEFRQFDPQHPPNTLPPQVNSRHPLYYLHYTNTANFTAPVAADARFNRQSNGQLAARLVFGATDKNEGDLSRVEVVLKNGQTVLETRQVDLDNKLTFNEGNADDLEFKNDIAVEGYQTSNMDADLRTDLKYGVVVRNLNNLGNCDTLVARVYDLGGNMAESAPIPVLNQTAFEQSLDFESGSATPPSWQARTSAATSIANDGAFAHGGTHSLLATDGSDLAVSQQAAIESGLASGRFEWRAEGWIYQNVLELRELGKQVYLFEFLDGGGTNLSVSARLRKTESSIVAGIVAKQPGGTSTCTDGGAVGPPGTVWQKWTLRLLRVGTRETTAVLFLDGGEWARLSWDSTGYEPLKVRVGVGQSFSKVKAILHMDDVLITEKIL